MSRSHPMYRIAVRLYPKAFRDEYGDDLVQHFDDLVADRGTAAAWARTGLDLVVTVPRYRMETLMNARQSAVAITAVTGLLAVVGAAGVLVGAYPGGLLLVVALVLALARGSAMARVVRPPDNDRRRRRLLTAAALGVVFVTTFVIYLSVIGDSWTTRETVLAVIGNAAMIGALAFLIGGLLTPRTPRTSAPATAGPYVE